MFTWIKDKLLAGLFVMAIAGYFLIGMCCPAEASIIDDLSNSTFSGMVMLEDRNEAMFENITIYTPEDEEVFGIPIDIIRYKIVRFGNDDMVDDLLAAGSIDKSNTFLVSYRKLDEPFPVNAGGFLYDVSRHWLGEDAPPVYLGFYMMDTGDPLYTLYGKVYLSEFIGESGNGYYAEADILLGMEDWFNRDFLDGKISLGKDTDPSGSTYIEVFLYNISGVTYGGFGGGFRF